MAPRKDGIAQKPAGGRSKPLQRNPFARKNSASTRSSSDTNRDYEPEPRASTSHSVEITENGRPFVYEEPPSGAWIDGGMTTSPNASEETFSLRSEAHSSAPTGRPSYSRERGLRPTPLATSTLDLVVETPEVSPKSPSKARWEHLREHVLPVAQPPAHSAVSTPSSSEIAFSQPAPPRSQTPKPSRLQRLGLRGVVDQAREVAVDETRKFAGLLHKTCWAAQFPDQPPRVANKNEFLMGTMGTNIYLPASLSSSVTASNATITTMHSTAPRRSGPMRRPESMQSINLANRTGPSLNNLRQILLQHASPGNTAPLPHESLVLSTLLGPFLTFETGTKVDEERWFAVESFEVISQSWIASSPVASIERCLWCCKAALIPHSNVRLRVLRALSSLFLSKERPLQITSAGALSTLLEALFTLIPTLSSVQESLPQAQMVKDLISRVNSGICGSLDTGTGEHKGPDDQSSLRQTIVTEALVACLEYSAEPTRRWLLQNLVEEFWPAPPSSLLLTPLQTTIVSKKLSTFCKASLSMVADKSTVDVAGKKLDMEIIVRIMRTRVIPECQALQGPSAVKGRDSIASVLIEILSTDGVDLGIREWAGNLLCNWYRDSVDWKASIENALKHIIGGGVWNAILRILSALVTTLPEEIRKPIFASLLPIFSEHLATEPPPFPCLPLTTFLDTVSRLYPQVFYKPLFACAASSKDAIVINHLWMITVISRFLPDFWVRDAEMISVALMSGGKAKATPEGSEPVWGTARLGQSVLLLELIARAHAARKTSDATSDHSQTKFFALLEVRLSILLEAKERAVLVPPSQRVLFCALFLEIRSLTRSLKPCAWFPRVISWFLQSCGVAESADDDEVFREVEDSSQQLLALYVAAQEGPRAIHKRRSTMVFSPNIDGSFPLSSTAAGPDDHFSVFGQRTQLIRTLKNGVAPKAVEVMVLLSGMLSTDDYKRIGEPLWRRCLNAEDPKLTASICFLVMQCAEKTPDIFIPVVESDLCNSDPSMRLQAIQKIGILTNWRFQILSQPIILDRSYRRAFKVARGPLPFVATDVGSSLFVLEEDVTEGKGKLPLELRKRLSEIGWEDDDKPMDQKHEWIRTPMYLLPSYQLDRLDDQVVPSSPISSPLSSPMRPPTSPGKHEPLLRRKTSTVGAAHSVKRRTLFVPSLAALFPRIVSLVFDSDLVVATTTRDVVVDLMRNDPALLGRPIFDLFAEDQKSIDSAVFVVRTLLHIRKSLPPAMTHYIFNHFAGFLKMAAKRVDSSESFRSFAYTVPVLSNIATQVSDMSFRELRRAKIELFLMPSDSLWFSSSAPPVPMFPRSLPPVINPFENPPELQYITMIRLSQNNLFMAMLKRNPNDVQLIRKNLPPLILPSRQSGETHPLELADFVPHKAEVFRHEPLSLDAGLQGFSVMISRSYLLLIAQVFRSMSRHLNTRDDIALPIDGLNRILLRHGDDIGIVSQAMITLMVASTRFRRLFTSGGGYTLFMPAVVKVYAESEAHVGIRRAIEYTVHRFYALHQDSFVFQSLDIISHVVMTPDVQGDWLAKSMYSLFSTLGGAISASTPDAAGIHNSNKIQEQEALLISTAEEKPQTFFASLRRGGGADGKERLTFDLPEEYETRSLHIDNFVRLFLTVIAHDPTILRAEQFLRFLRYLVPHLCQTQGSVRSVLRDGIDALGVVLIRAAAKAKIPDSAVIQPTNDSSFEVFNEEAALGKQLLTKSKSPSDLMSMRLDYLSLVTAFTASGGTLGSAAHIRTIDLTKAMLKDSTRDTSKPIAEFYSQYTKTSLLRDNPPSLKEITSFLREIAPVVNAYSMSVDFRGVFEALEQLSSNPIYANDLPFSRLVVHQFCGAGLEACESAAAERLLLSLPLRPSLVSLIVRAVSLRGADVIAEVERRAPCYEFLAGVVLPLVMTLRTTSDVVSDMRFNDPWRRSAQSNTWVRLLAYVMSACNRKQDKVPLERSRSRDRDRANSDSSGKARMKALVAAIQILKVIVVRAEEDLSACLPGIWSRVAAFLKTLLADGNSAFAFGSSDYSPAPSPTPSPRASLSIPSNFMEKGSLSSPAFEVRNRPALTNPRIVDYSMWSLLELLSLCRSPLTMQMRLFMQEKVALLDQELRTQETQRGPSRRSGRRVSSSAFSKPRRHVSGYTSGGPSPDASPRLSASQSFPVSDMDLRQPGYARFPSSPGQQDAEGPRIVHLGPVSRQGLPFQQRALSPGMSSEYGDGGTRMMAKSATVKSVKLILATYRRIRLVQTCLGYDALLPMPKRDIGGGGDSLDQDEDLAAIRTWTKSVALESIVGETRELMEEFDEGFREVEDDMVVIDADQSVTF